MKKEFINPAVRVIKFDSEGLMNQTSPTVIPGETNMEDAPAPTRVHIFENSEF